MRIIATAKNVNIGNRATKQLLNVCQCPQCSTHDRSTVRGSRPLLLQTGWCRAGYRMIDDDPDCGGGDDGDLSSGSNWYGDGKNYYYNTAIIKK